MDLDATYSGRSDEIAYEYRSLDLNRAEIRVLVLNPGQGNDPINGRLVHAFLDDQPNFETISYCWGDQNDTDTIRIDGELHSVPASAAMALRRMRTATSERSLWIDAVCINQSEVQEKNHQVALMRDIYSSGQTNLIFLGEADPAIAEEAVSGILALEEEVRRETDGFEAIYTLLGLDDNGYVRVSDTAISAPFNPEALLVFFHSPWFSRVWVMSEAAISPWNVCFFGEYSIELLAIVRACRLITVRWSSVPGELSWLRSVQNGAMLWSYVEPQERMAREQPASKNVLILSVELKASEPRDHVFGLLGLMVPRSGHIPPGLKPDYSKPLVAVFRDATVYALWGNRFHSISAFLWHRSQEEVEDDAWPSWLPKWHRPRDRWQDPVTLQRRLFSAGENVVEFEDRNGIRHKYSDRGELEVCKVTPPPAVDLAQTIQVVSIEVDTVASTTSTFAADDYLPSVQGRLREVFSLVGIDQAQPEEDDVDERRRREAMIFSLIGGAGSHLEPATSAQFEQFDDCMNLVLHQHKVPSRPQDLTAASSPSERSASPYYYRFCHACVGRRIFRTTEGRIGVGPRVTREGDVVAILAGSAMPCILRPWDDNKNTLLYKFVGDCYVHGIMHGEATAERMAQIILLC